MSTKGVEYILGCTEFGDEQWVRLIELRVERMGPDLKDIAVTKFGSAPLLRSEKPGPISMWVGIDYRRQPEQHAHRIFDVRGIPFVVKSTLEPWEATAYNATDSDSVPEGHSFLFGLTQQGEWAFIDVTLKWDLQELPLRWDVVWPTTPREIVKRAGVNLAWIYEALLREAYKWKNARERRLEEARALTNDLMYEHRLVWDVYRAHEKRG